LAVVSTLAFTAIGVATVLGLSTHDLVLMAVGVFVIVYVFGSAAALRLLARGTWAYRSAVVALVSSVALLATVGPSLLWPLGVASAALIYLQWRRWAASRSRAPVAAADQPDEVPVGRRR